MPHYTDFNGFLAEIPRGSNQFWGSFATGPDLDAGSDDVAWSQYDPNSPAAILGQDLNATFWQESGLPQPKIFAVMVNAQYTNPSDTDFKVWDVSPGTNGGDVSPREGTYSRQSLLGETSNTPSVAIENVYFDVEALPALGVPSLDSLGAIVLVACILGSLLFAKGWRSFRRRKAA